MEGFVKSRWTELGAMQVHLMGKGLFVFQMESKDAKQGALEKGPWSFSRRPLILRPWTVVIALEKPDMGKPLFADRNTSEQKLLGYARVCVEVKVESTLFGEIPVKYANGYVHYQKVHYEWVPSKCMKFRVFGHTDQHCKAAQVFVPKQAARKEVMVERDIPTSSGSLKFRAIEVDQVTLLPTPTGSVIKEHRPDTPISTGDTEVSAMKLSPIGEDDGGEDLAAESTKQQRGSIGNIGKSKKKARGNGRVAAPPPKHG
ncbi:hypothetical protein LIER_31122 [Lithospermum erythrorhizon]|uniref:DUF4283 domain-containing protein n=1 Tax=Lithospermum erythrorhizon TaxID=34254 RepID=A0AAV3RPY1_LITER